MRKIADMPMEYHAMKVKELDEFVTSIFPGNETLKAEKSCMLCNSIPNYTVDKLNRPDCGSGVGRYSSNKKLQMDHI